MQGQENRKADILGLEADLSNEAAELLLDEDAQVVKTRKGFMAYLFILISMSFFLGIYRITVGCT